MTVKERIPLSHMLAYSTWEAVLAPVCTATSQSSALATLAAFSTPPSLAPAAGDAVDAIAMIEADDPHTVFVADWACVDDSAALLEAVGFASCVLLLVCDDADAVFDALHSVHPLIKENTIRLLQKPIGGARLRMEAQQVHGDRCRARCGF